jgi:hypothetical protein
MLPSARGGTEMRAAALITVEGGLELEIFKRILGAETTE